MAVSSGGGQSGRQGQGKGQCVRTNDTKLQRAEYGFEDSSLTTPPARQRLGYMHDTANSNVFHVTLRRKHLKAYRVSVSQNGRV